MSQANKDIYMDSYISMQKCIIYLQVQYLENIYLRYLSLAQKIVGVFLNLKEGKIIGHVIGRMCVKNCPVF
jgi:hypothetical protein